MPNDVAAEVPDDCTVFRVVKKADIKPDGTPESGCFADKAADDGSSNYMSVYFSDEIEDAKLSVRDLQEKWGSDIYTVVAFHVAVLRAEGERLWRDPNDDFVGHGACKRLGDSTRTRSQKRRLAKLSKPVPGLD